MQPIQLLFNRLDIRPHVTIPALRDVVADYIKSEHNGEVVDEGELEHIPLDPGGMMYMEGRAEWLVFKINGTPFRCQTIHVEGVCAYLRKGIRMVNSSAGKLVKIYLPYQILVLPAEYLWELNQRLEFNLEAGRDAREEIVRLLAEANAPTPDDLDVH